MNSNKGVMRKGLNNISQTQPRREIKLDYQTISVKYLDMQEGNERLQKLIGKFTTDPDRRLRSVFESVQHQNSVARDYRKTSANAKPKDRTDRIHGSFMPPKAPLERNSRLYNPKNPNSMRTEKQIGAQPEVKPRPTPVFPSEYPTSFDYPRLKQEHPQFDGEGFKGHLTYGRHQIDFEQDLQQEELAKSFQLSKGFLFNK